jgi:hypothetical protein
MGSNNKDVQLAQQERVTKELATRLATLKERGMSEEATKKDRAVRSLRASIKQIRKRVIAIDAQGVIFKQVAEQKAARLALPRVKKKKVKPVEAAPAKSSKKKKPPKKA